MATPSTGASRFVYAFMLAEHYDGSHRVRPVGVPDKTEVWHATRGRIASYSDGDVSAMRDEKLWNQALAEDANGRFDRSFGVRG